jgi:hypothetical protein
MKFEHWSTLRKRAGLNFIGRTQMHQRLVRYPDRLASLGRAKRDSILRAYQQAGDYKGAARLPASTQLMRLVARRWNGLSPVARRAYPLTTLSDGVLSQQDLRPEPQPGHNRAGRIARPGSQACHPFGTAYPTDFTGVNANMPLAGYGCTGRRRVLTTSVAIPRPRTLPASWSERQWMPP